MPKQPAKPAKKSQSQRQRFIDTAKELEADVTGEAFEKVFKKVVPARKVVQRPVGKQCDDDVS